MTPQDHNKVIGIMHLIYGGFNALVMFIILLIFVPFTLAIGSAAASDPNAPTGLIALFSAFGLLVLLLALAFCLPPILAGYAMLKRRSWARVMGIIAACLSALSPPFGTALCIYTLWFLFGQGEQFYRGSLGSAQKWRAPLYEGSAGDLGAQTASRAGRQREYVPPPQPPDWRGQ